MSTSPEEVGPLDHAAPGAPGALPREIEAPEPHLRAVEPRPRRRPHVPSRLPLWFAVIVTAGSLFLLVAFNVFMVQGQFDLDQISQQRSDAQNRYEHLRAQVATLSSPAVIVGHAQALGYEEPSQVWWVPANLQPPAPAAHPRSTSQQTYDGVKGRLAASP